MKRSLPFVIGVLWLAGAAPLLADGILVGGRVLGPGGDPLPRADVQLIPLVESSIESRTLFVGEAPEPAARVLTDDSGRFHIEAPHAGLWRVRVEAPGFAAREAVLEPLIESLELPELTLPEDSGVIVRVKGDDEKAIAGAFVLVRTDRGLLDSIGPRSWSAPLRGGLTVADGTIRLPRGQGERITVTASSPGRVVAERRGLRGTSATLALRGGVARAVLATTGAGRPVPGAVVLVGGRAHPVAITDAKGGATVRIPGGEGLELQLVAEDGRQAKTRIRVGESSDDKPRTIVLPESILASGRLIDADSRRPIAAAVVYDSDRPTIAAVTDRAGGFVLRGSRGSRLELTAGAPGYLQPDRPLELVLADDGRPGPTLALRPAAAIEGRVADRDGSALAGAEITIEETQTPGMMRIEIGRPSSPPRALTDSEGRYRLSRVDPAKNWVVKGGLEGFAPAETTVAGLEPHETRSEVDLELSRGRSIVGKVKSADGLPVTAASVTVAEADADGHMGMMRVSRGGRKLELTTQTDGEGRFVLDGLPRGKFDIVVERRGFAPGELKGLQLVETAEGPLDAGEIVLEPGETVQGIVVDRDGAPIEGVEIHAAAAGGAPMMVMIGGAEPPDPKGPDAVTDSAGWFSISDLSPEKKYTVSASRTGYLGANAGPLPLPRGEPVTLTLEAASAVRGSVLDEEGEPIASASVEMTRSRTIEMGNNVMQTIMMLSETTDSEGRFVFEEQEPGEMSLKANANGYQEGKLDGLTIPKGADLDDVELRLSGGAAVTGQVLGPDGQPVVGANVQVAGEGEGFMRMLNGVPTDGNGVYRLEGLGAGAVSIEATHEDWPRTVRDTEVEIGVNYLDLSFEGGVEVQGRVATASGEPVAGAVVRLVPAGRSFGGPSTTTGVDGEYRMPGVQDGDYRVLAQAPGYAASFGEANIKVDGDPVYGVDVELNVGAAIRGHVTGLEEDLLGDVTVEARGGGFSGFDGVGVDRSGAYRIDNLEPGSYNVVATVANSGKRAGGEVTIEPDVEEVTVDVQFEPGLALSGRAVQGGVAVRGATVYVEGTSVQHSGWNETDQEGRFEIDGLEPGDYSVRLRHWQTGLAYDESVSLTANRQITLEVPTARVGGRIVDGADRQPLAGVSLSLTSDDTTSAMAGLPMHAATSDQEGKFEFNSVGDGNWTLSASKQGYAALTRSVAVQSEQSPEDLRLSLDPTEGVTLELRLPSGAPPTEVLVAVLDGGGGTLMNGNYATGENGRVRLSSVPPGRFSLVVSAAGSATSRVEVQSPGPAVGVALPPATSLRVRVAELAGATIATVRLYDAAGQPFYGLSWSGRPMSEWRMEGGSAMFDELPPGSWTVSVETADGRNWQGSRTTAPGSTAELILE